MGHFMLNWLMTPSFHSYPNRKLICSRKYPMILLIKMIGPSPI